MTNSTSSLTSEIIDEEISLDQLQHVSGGILPLLAAGGSLGAVITVKVIGGTVAGVGVAIAYGVSKYS